MCVPYADCCDGSDENSGKCPTTCQEAGKEYRSALKAQATAMKIGLKAKEKYISKAAVGKQQWQQELSKLQTEESELQKAVDGLKGGTKPSAMEGYFHLQPKSISTLLITSLVELRSI